MKNRSLALAALAFLGSVSLESFDYKVSGRAESFSKVGFNNTSINSAKGKYPTESFVTMVGALQINMNLLNSQDQNLSAGLGGMIGGIAYDSTRNLADETTGKKNGSVAYNYIGYWGRYYGDAPWSGDTGFSDNTRNYVLYDAYLDYDYRGMFGIKAGRYESEAEFHSSYTQGFQTYVKFSDFKLWWFSSYGRAFAYDQWLYDFYAPKVKDSKGKSVNYGIHAFQASYSHEGLLISPFVYFSPETVVAPSIKVQYDTRPDFKGVGFRSKTTLYGLFPIIDDNLIGTYRYGNLVAKTAQTLIIKQHFDLDNYNIGGGIYINFGNANAHFGTYGNPVGFDFWTGSAYDIGPALSDMMTKDARTGFLYGGGKHGKFSWGILGRITFSERSDEQNIAVNVGYEFPYNISAGLKLEYFNDITKAGYKVGNYGQVPGQPEDISDRSHMMAFIRHSF